LISGVASLTDRSRLLGDGAASPAVVRRFFDSASAVFFPSLLAPPLSGASARQVFNAKRASRNMGAAMAFPPLIVGPPSFLPHNVPYFALWSPPPLQRTKAFTGGFKQKNLEEIPPSRLATYSSPFSLHIGDEVLTQRVSVWSCSGLAKTFLRERKALLAFPSSIGSPATSLSLFDALRMRFV